VHWDHSGRCSNASVQEPGWSKEREFEPHVDQLFSEMRPACSSHQRAIGTKLRRYKSYVVID
jgi:hypothetical protein